MSSIYDFEAEEISGATLPLKRFHDRVLLIVNTASKCGFTPQYDGLESLHRAFAPDGLVVMGFPCNQFGGQEPGDANAIITFCRESYNVTFPIFAKIEVNGPAAHPLYRWLTREARGILGTRRIKWNFTKFLIDRSGRPVRRFAPFVPPEKLRQPIEKLL